MQARILERIIELCVILFASISCNGNHNEDRHDSDTGNLDAGHDAGQQLIDPEIDWLTITAGSFTFGSPGDAPCLKPLMEKEVPVMLTHPFLISKYEVTQKQWKALGLKIPPIDPICDDCPISFLNTNEAKAWCNALSRFEGLEECYDLSSCTGSIGGACWPATDSDCNEVTGAEYVCSGKTRKYDSMYDCQGYRLPTGPEWEYAAKAGTTTHTYNGDITAYSYACLEEPILNDIAWYCWNSGYMGGSDPWSIDSLELLQPVGQKQPNPWGLYDMLGNAYEWTDYVGTGLSLDTNEGKPGEALVDPMGAAEDVGSRGDLRGGDYSTNTCMIRAASQLDDIRYYRGPGYGFRPVRTLPATSTDAGVK